MGSILAFEGLGQDPDQDLRRLGQDLDQDHVYSSWITFLRFGGQTRYGTPTRSWSGSCPSHSIKEKVNHLRVGINTRDKRHGEHY